MDRRPRIHRQDGVRSHRTRITSLKVSRLRHNPDPWRHWHRQRIRSRISRLQIVRRGPCRRPAHQRRPERKPHQSPQKRPKLRRLARNHRPAIRQALRHKIQQLPSEPDLSNRKRPKLRRSAIRQSAGTQRQSPFLAIQRHSRPAHKAKPQSARR